MQFYEELEQVYDPFPKYHMKILLKDFKQKWGERMFSNRLLGMLIYTMIMMIIVLE
jgi:hypothetical protein